MAKNPGCKKCKYYSDNSVDPSVKYEEYRRPGDPVRGDCCWHSDNFTKTEHYWGDEEDILNKPKDLNKYRDCKWFEEYEGE
jgi:hypothetical protein